MKYVDSSSSQYANALRLVRNVLTVLVPLLVIVFGALAMPHITGQFDRWGLLPRHEQMTELYVSNPKQLPKTYKPGEQHTVQFEIHNLEDRTRTYEYTVTAHKANKRVAIELGKGTLKLQPGDTRSTRIMTPLNDMGERVYMQIELSNGQKIGYWLGQER